MFDMSV